MNIQITKKKRVETFKDQDGNDSEKYLHSKRQENEFSSYLIQKKRAYIKPDQLQNRTLDLSPFKQLRRRPMANQFVKKNRDVKTKVNGQLQKEAIPKRKTLHLNLRTSIDHGTSIIHETPQKVSTLQRNSKSRLRPMSARPVMKGKRHSKPMAVIKRPLTARVVSVSNPKESVDRKIQTKRATSIQNLQKLQKSYGDKSLNRTKKRYKPTLIDTNNPTTSDLIETLAMPFAKNPKLTRLLYTPRKSFKKKKKRGEIQEKKTHKKKKLEGHNDVVLSKENSWLNSLHESNLPIYNAEEGLPLNSGSLLELKKWLQKRDKKVWKTDLSLPLHNVYCKKDTLKAYSFGDKGDEYHRYDQLDFVHDMNMYQNYAKSKHARQTKRENIVSNIITTMSTTFERKDYPDKPQPLPEHLKNMHQKAS